MIHRQWKQRFSEALSAEKAQPLYCFSKISELEAWLASGVSDLANCHLLCDFDLNDPRQNGLEAIQALGLEQISTIVTNTSADMNLIKDCSAAGIKILPKGCIPTTTMEYLT